MRIWDILIFSIKIAEIIPDIFSFKLVNFGQQLQIANISEHLKIKLQTSEMSDEI